MEKSVQGIFTQGGSHEAATENMVYVRAGSNDNYLDDLDFNAQGGSMKTIWEPTLLLYLGLTGFVFGVWGCSNKTQKKTDVVKLSDEEQMIRNIVDPNTSYLNSDGIPLALSLVWQNNQYVQFWNKIDCEDKMKPFFLKDKIKYINTAGDEIIFYKGLWTVKGSMTHKEKVWEWEQQREADLESIKRRK